MHIWDAAAIDETVIKDAARKNGSTINETAPRLAIEKAAIVSGRLPGAYVVGADQMLECEGRWFDIPTGNAGAINHLRSLRGRTHNLISATAVTKDGNMLWQHVDTARLTMRMFSDDFLNHYVRINGTDITGSIGAYRIEGAGTQLFEAIEGDYFSILGLPLIPLLSFLRSEGISPT